MSPSLTGSLRPNSPTGKTSISASESGFTPGYWAGTITGTGANILLFQNTSSQPVGMVEYSIDGAAWTAAAVSGGRYQLFSGLAQAERIVMVRINQAYGATGNIPNTGNSMTVTGSRRR